jgi:formylglycine-generating enzyme required for sulfatase activity
VSWGEAQQYVKWLSTMTGQDYRLLSEAEWEYAARAGTTTRWSSGDYEAEAALGDYAWYYENSGNRTHPVGQKKPNAFGLHDMHGNLWEWVEDCYHDNYDAAPADGKPRTEGADCNGRVVRGGSWGTVPNMLRSAFREWVHLEGESPRGGPVVERSQCLHLALSDMSRCPTLESAKRSKADFDQAASPIVIL